MSKPAKETYYVLVADDSPDERFLITAAMQHTARLQTIAEVCDGAETIDYLKGLAGFSDREKFPLPDLLLLDLKMPGKDGFEVLEWLAMQPFSGLTIVVLTDSMHPEHIKRALDLGADLFQVKPRSHNDRQAMIQALEDFLVGASSAPLQRPGTRQSGHLEHGESAAWTY
ncbi:MAG: response regulator receiver protein [Pedosphaera sp.]|nr:response regulator receiver protein [Pedosphaera sp.]